MPFVHITIARCSLESCSFYPGVSWSPLTSTCRNGFCVFFSWLHNQHNGGFNLVIVGMFTPQKLVKLQVRAFLLPDCWLFNNSLAHPSTTLNSSLMLGFPSPCCMTRGHTWNPEDKKASLRRGALLHPFVKFFPLPWYILTWPLLFARPVLITLCIKSLIPVR